MVRHMSNPQWIEEILPVEGTYMSRKPLFSNGICLFRVKRLTCYAAYFVEEMLFWSTNAKTGASFNGNRGVYSVFLLKNGVSR